MHFDHGCKHTKREMLLKQGLSFLSNRVVLLIVLILLSSVDKDPGHAIRPRPPTVSNLLVIRCQAICIGGEMFDRGEGCSQTEKFRSLYKMSCHSTSIDPNQPPPPFFIHNHNKWAYLPPTRLPTRPGQLIRPLACCQGYTLLKTKK